MDGRKGRWSATIQLAVCTACGGPGAVFLVQVFAHLPEHEAQVVTIAREFDEEAQRRGTVRFESPYSRVSGWRSSYCYRG